MGRHSARGAPAGHIDPGRALLQPPLLLDAIARPLLLEPAFLREAVLRPMLLRQTLASDLLLECELALRLLTGDAFGLELSLDLTTLLLATLGGEALLSESRRDRTLDGGPFLALTLFLGQSSPGGFRARDALTLEMCRTRAFDAFELKTFRALASDAFPLQPLHAVPFGQLAVTTLHLLASSLLLCALLSGQTFLDRRATLDLLLRATIAGLLLPDLLLLHPLTTRDELTLPPLSDGLVTEELLVGGTFGGA